MVHFLDRGFRLVGTGPPGTVCSYVGGASLSPTWMHDSINDWVNESAQPPGLMKMRLMHHQQHQEGHQA